MAAEVSSSLVRVLSGHMEEQPQIHAGNSDILITKDLLGSLSKAATSTKDIDLEFKAGKVQSQRCSSSSPKSPLSASAKNSSPDHGKYYKNQSSNSLQDSKLQDLNFPPINLFEDMSTSLDLKLQSSSTPTPSPYQSVCTLDKVKFALERAEKETMKKRSSSPPPPPPPAAAAAANSLSSSAAISSPPSSSSSSSSSSTTPGLMFAAACPGCMLYVIASRTNPRCPRCNSFVPSSLAVKKPRIDLNASF